MIIADDDLYDEEFLLLEAETMRLLAEEQQEDPVDIDQFLGDYNEPDVDETNYDPYAGCDTYERDEEDYL